MLTAPRRAVLDALVALSADAGEAARVLKLGPSQLGEIERNRRLRSSPVLPAIERYSGVVYDAVGVASLDEDARGWLDRHVLIASALFGLLEPEDPIPAYRLSGSTALPGLPLPRHWSGPIARTLARNREWLLDARSSAYRALGPVPPGSAVLHVEAEAADGRRRALNHFNKHAKGALVRRLAQTGAEIPSRDALLEWGTDARLRLEARGDHDVTLVVAETPAGAPAPD